MMRSNDAPLLAEMSRRLSERTRRLRYHAYTASVPQEEAISSADLNSGCQAALVAVCRDDAGEHIVGLARLARASPEAAEAETVFLVCDEFQGLGLGTRLYVLLLSVAHAMGIKRIIGWVMVGNQPMLRVYKKTHLPVRVQFHAGEMLVEISLTTD